MLFLVIVLFVFITQYLLPNWWWLIAVDCFLATLLVGKKGWTAFLSGFLGGGLVWTSYALLINNQNEGLLLGRMAQLFGRELWIIIATGFIGAIMGGMSALTGYYFKAMWEKVDD